MDMISKKKNHGEGQASLRIKKCLWIPVLCLGICHAGNELPLEVANLQSQRDRKIAEINKVYAKELEKLKEHYMKAGDLATSNKINEMIQQVEQTKTGLIPVNKATQWKWDSTEMILTLSPDGKAPNTIWPRTASWKLQDDGSVLLTLANQTAYKIEFDGRTAKVTGLNKDAIGYRGTLKLVE